MEVSSHMANKKQLSEYEQRALRQIHAWKNPTRTWLDAASNVVNWPLQKAGETVMKVPGLKFAVEKSLQGFLGVVNDAAQWSVRPDAVRADLERVSGSRLSKLSDSWGLDLEFVDRAIGWLDTKYEGLALVEGAAAGGSATISPLAAAAAIPVDVVALLTLNLRAVGEYASYCGFDLTSQEERLFALNTLALASSPTDQSKQVALAQLVRIAKDVALGRTWKELEQHLYVQAIQQIANALSIRLTKAKLANTIPAAGALIGGGFNAYFTDKCCKSAFYLYRERFLSVKYGENLIEETVPPADTINPNYDEDLDDDES